MISNNNNTNSESYKRRVYENWIERGRPWFNIDTSKEPTYAERQVIIEIKKRENARANHDKELEKRAAEIRERHGKKGKIPDSIFDIKI